MLTSPYARHFKDRSVSMPKAELLIVAVLVGVLSGNRVLAETEVVVEETIAAPCCQSSNACCNSNGCSTCGHGGWDLWSLLQNDHEVQWPVITPGCMLVMHRGCTALQVDSTGKTGVLNYDAKDLVFIHFAIIRLTL